jgi:hypothetical protein
LDLALTLLFDFAVRVAQIIACCLVEVKGLRIINAAVDATAQSVRPGQLNTGVGLLGSSCLADIFLIDLIVFFDVASSPEGTRGSSET